MSSPHRLHSFRGQCADSGGGGGGGGRTAFERARPGSNLSRPFPNRRWSDGCGRADGRADARGRTDGGRIDVYPSVRHLSLFLLHFSLGSTVAAAALCKGDVTREGSNKRKARSERVSDRPPGLRKRWPRCDRRWLSRYSAPGTMGCWMLGLASSLWWLADDAACHARILRTSCS